MNGGQYTNWTFCLQKHRAQTLEHFGSETSVNYGLANQQRTNFSTICIYQLEIKIMQQVSLLYFSDYWLNHGIVYFEVLHLIVYFYLSFYLKVSLYVWNPLLKLSSYLVPKMLTHQLNQIELLFVDWKKSYCKINRNWDNNIWAVQLINQWNSILLVHVHMCVCSVIREWHCSHQ